MYTKELGKTGVMIPEVGLGTWDYQGGTGPLRRGLETGALFIDTAESYGTEAVVGQAIRDVRSRVFVATKVSPHNFRPNDLRRSVETSLRLLGVETIDLLQLHHPNPAIPIQETIGTMTEVAEEGKIRFLGVSNFSLSELQAAQDATGKYPIVSNQLRYNLIDRTVEKELLPFCQGHGITVIAYSPLARGLSRVQDCDPRGILLELSRSTGKSPAQIILNWCLCREGVVVIPKGNSQDHILENCAASDWRLTPEQVMRLDSEIFHRHRNRFDMWVRKATPHRLPNMALSAIERLPASLRRRIT